MAVHEIGMRKMNMPDYEINGEDDEVRKKLFLKGKENQRCVRLQKVAKPGTFGTVDTIRNLTRFILGSGLDSVRFSIPM